VNVLGELTTAVELNDTPLVAYEGVILEIVTLSTEVAVGETILYPVVVTKTKLYNPFVVIVHVPKETGVEPPPSTGNPDVIGKVTVGFDINW
jgi:hypothetical protein